VSKKPADGNAVFPAWVTAGVIALVATPLLILNLVLGLILGFIWGTSVVVDYLCTRWRERELRRQLREYRKKRGAD